MKYSSKARFFPLAQERMQVSLIFLAGHDKYIKLFITFAPSIYKTKFYLIIQKWQQELDCKDSVVKTTRFIRS